MNENQLRTIRNFYEAVDKIRSQINTELEGISVGLMESMIKDDPDSALALIKATKMYGAAYLALAANRDILNALFSDQDMLHAYVSGDEHEQLMAIMRDLQKKRAA